MIRSNRQFSNKDQINISCLLHSVNHSAHCVWNRLLRFALDSSCPMPKISESTRIYFNDSRFISWLHVHKTKPLTKLEFYPPWGTLPRGYNELHGKPVSCGFSVPTSGSLIRLLSVLVLPYKYSLVIVKRAKAIPAPAWLFSLSITDTCLNAHFNASSCDRSSGKSETWGGKALSQNDSSVHPSSAGIEKAHLKYSCEWKTLQATSKSSRKHRPLPSVSCWLHAGTCIRF